MHVYIPEPTERERQTYFDLVIFDLWPQIARPIYLSFCTCVPSLNFSFWSYGQTWDRRTDRHRPLIVTDTSNWVRLVDNKCEHKNKMSPRWETQEFCDGQTSV